MPPLRYLLLVLLVLLAAPTRAQQRPGPLAPPVPAVAAPSTPLPATAEAFQAALRRPDLPDTLRVLYLNNLARFAQVTDPTQAHRYVDLALSLARRVGYRQGEANALLMQGSIATASNDALTSQTKTLAALRLFRHLGNREGMGSSLQALGTVAVLAGDHARALQYYQQADSTFRLLMPPCLRCELSARANMANEQLALGQRAAALRTFRQVLARTQGQNDAFGQVRLAALAGIADELARAGRPDSAVLLLHQALALARRSNDQYAEITLLNSLTMRYAPTELADLRQQEYYARQAVRVGRASRQQQPLQVALGNLAEVLHRLGHPAAYDTLLSYLLLSQHLQTAERTKALADAQTRYDMQGQQATIRDLRKDRRLSAQQRELAHLRQRQERLGTGALVALLLLLGGGTFWQYRRHQQQQRTQAAIALRTRLAADLHDDVGNLLTQITLQSDLLRESSTATPAQTLARLERLRDTSRRAARQMADVVWGLHASNATWPEMLTHMRDHAYEVLPPANLAIDFGVSPEAAAAQPGQEVSQQLYLIYKECLHNAVKHARHATQVTVRLWVNAAGQLCLAVQDDAPGPAPVGRAGGQGLNSMRQRAEAVGGSLTVAPGTGGFGVEACLPG
ncbi:histidine kinase [Hymenobacter sp. ASUV-10]|uniref:Histidine kinase n=1 Tax=Hymenobacter aranciens TaxID=3063996 RepID=A0ABT9BFE5_9BACT|nr:histidine kinase [Hymenobacter sp. ASUV-10]MDO7876962.1 histidine kinase [Hymenobacter sp. ASUV-10]